MATNEEQIKYLEYRINKNKKLKQNWIRFDISQLKIDKLQEVIDKDTIKLNELLNT